MTTPSLMCLTQISNYLQVPVKKMSLNSEKMPTCILNDKSFTGFVNIIVNLVSHSQSSLFGNNNEQQCEVRQWLEYCVVHLLYVNNAQCANQVLQEFNVVLETRTYFVGNYLTIADVAVYYLLKDLMEKLTYQQKEKYLNVSRWFDNIQQNDSIRSKNSHVDFSTLFLTCVTLR